MNWWSESHEQKEKYVYCKGKKVQDKIKDCNFINQKVVIRERFCKPYPTVHFYILYWSKSNVFEIYYILSSNCKPNLDQIYWSFITEWYYITFTQSHHHKHHFYYKPITMCHLINNEHFFRESFNKLVDPKIVLFITIKIVVSLNLLISKLSFS